jgi:hypothetical protein
MLAVRNGSGHGDNRAKKILFVLTWPGWGLTPEDAEILRDPLPADVRHLMFYDAGHRLKAHFETDAASLFARGWWYDSLA